MNRRLRKYFDEQLEGVLAQLPERVHALLDEVPMYVEDYPARHVLSRQGIRRRWTIQGHYDGTPLTERHVEASGRLSDAIYVYREGILALARDHTGEIDETELRRQIRITILHELGHYHGLNEDELRDLGYA